MWGENHWVLHSFINASCILIYNFAKNNWCKTVEEQKNVEMWCAGRSVPHKVANMLLNLT